MEPGQQLAQACHCVQQFNLDHYEVAKNWSEKSNYIAVLAAKNEEELLRLIEKASSRGVKYSFFRETDLEDTITAVALEPGVESKRLCSSFGLALKKIHEK